MPRIIGLSVERSSIVFDLLRFRWTEMITLSYTIVVQIRCLCSPGIAVGKPLLFLVSGNQHQFLRIIKQERKNATSCACVWY